MHPTSDLKDYLKKRVGFSDEEAIFLSEEIAKFLLESFACDRYAKIDGLGKLKATLSHSDSRYPEGVLKGSIAFTSKSGELIKLARNNGIDLSAKLERQAWDSPPKEIKVDKLRSKFRSYLQHEFPYGAPWTHPITKVLYSNESIKSALLILKEANEEAYILIWCLWVGVDLRYDYSKKIKLLKGLSYLEALENAIDSLIGILLIPDLDKRLVPHFFHSALDV